MTDLRGLREKLFGLLSSSKIIDGTTYSAPPEAICYTAPWIKKAGTKAVTVDFNTDEQLEDFKNDDVRGGSWSHVEYRRVLSWLRLYPLACGLRNKVHRRMMGWTGEGG